MVDLSIHVVDGAGPDLMGRDWLSQFPVPLEVHHVEQTTLHSVLDKYCSVFDNELGCMKGIEVELQTKPCAKPRFLKPRSVPYILKQKVGKELLRLESLGIISPVKTSKWAASIVSVMKKNGSVRVCGDFKTTYLLLNPTHFQESKNFFLI